MKTCTICRKPKSLESFYTSNSGTFGRAAQCKLCINAKRHEQRIAQGKLRKCEYCGEMTKSKDEMCNRCAKQATKDFGAILGEEHSEPRQYQRWYAQCAYDKSVGVEARLKWRKILKGMDEADKVLPPDLRTGYDFERMVDERLKEDPDVVGERYVHHRLGIKEYAFHYKVMGDAYVAALGM